MLIVVLAVLGGWLLASVLLALVIGRAIKLGDRDHKRKVAYRSASIPASAPMRARAAS